MGTDKRFISLRDVLASGLRDVALRVAQLDMSDPTPAEPTVECVEQWIQNASHELRKAAERGVTVPETVAVYADPRMIAAAVELSRSSMRLVYCEGGPSVLLAPPPPSYTLGTIAEEIERAANEAVKTQELPPPPDIDAMERMALDREFSS
jgi:hypothetical protein